MICLAAWLLQSKCLMNYELLTTLILLIICWLFLTVADVAVSGAVALLGGSRFRIVFLRGLWSLCIPVILMAYGMLVERNWYQVKRVVVESQSLPEGFDGFTIAFQTGL